MTESQVIQCARFNTTNFASNAEWTTTLKQPIILANGDSAVVSKSYLDTRLSSGGDIVIAKDTELSITMYFYQMFPPDGTSLNTSSLEFSTSVTDGTPSIDLPFNSAALNIPINVVPSIPAISILNPNDLSLWIAPFSELGGGGGNNWEAYQGGTAFDPTGNTFPNNNGVPVPPYAKFNSPPLYGYTHDPTTYTNNFINQSYAGQMPLLLVTAPKAPNFDVASSIPYTKIWKYTLKKGSYSPDELAEVLTRAMASIQSKEPTGNYTPFNQFGTTQTVADLNSFLAKGQQIVVASNNTPSYYPVPYKTDTGWREGMLYSSNDPDFQTFVGSPQTNCFLASFVAGQSIPPEYLSYDANVYVPSTNPICFQQTKFQAGYSAIGLQTVTDPGDATTIFNYTSPVIGCTSPELLFNDQAGVFQFGYTHTPLQELPTGGGIPGQNTGTNPIEVVKIIKTINIDFKTDPIPYDNFFSPQKSTVNITEHTKHSGVIFKKMEPESFWHGILGFNLDQICVKEEDIWGEFGNIDYARFNEVTTSGFVGLSNNFNYNNIGATTDNFNQPPYMGAVPLFSQKTGVSPEGTGELTYTNLLNSARWFAEQYIVQNNNTWGSDSSSFNSPVTDFPYCIFLPYFYEEYASALTATNPISAERAPLSNVENVGHYLIEVVAYGSDKELITSETVYQVKSILSSYYNSQGSFQSGVFPDSYVYTHTGETQIIHSFKIRIIDPYTMNTATTLGPSSSVYLQFNKALTQIATEEVS